MASVFVKIMLTVFVAEMGDKTQFMLIAMSSKYKMRDVITGTAAAILVLNGLAVLSGGLLSSLVPEWAIKIVASLAFMYFALTSFGDGDEDSERKSEGKKVAFAPIAVFCTFFLAELGDKTQLTAIAFGANEGIEKAALVWLACSAGLFSADVIGMCAGLLLKNRIPEWVLKALSFAVFSVFGILTIRQGFALRFGEGSPRVLLFTALFALVFALLCIIRFFHVRSLMK